MRPSGAVLSPPRQILHQRRARQVGGRLRDCTVLGAGAGRLASPHDSAGGHILVFDPGRRIARRRSRSRLAGALRPGRRIVNPAAFGAPLLRLRKTNHHTRPAGQAQSAQHIGTGGGLAANMIPDRVVSQVLAVRLQLRRQVQAERILPAREPVDSLDAAAATVEIAPRLRGWLPGVQDQEPSASRSTSARSALFR